jgi:hypothetical protein
MSADRFLVCFGLRWEVDADDESEVELLETRKDPRQLAARANKLDSWWGNTIDENRDYLFVGKILGNFGREGKDELRVNVSECVAVMDATRRKLQSAGFADEPAWYFQFELDR